MEEKGRDSVSCGVEKERGLTGLGFTLHFSSTIFFFFVCVCLVSKGKREIPGEGGKHKLHLLQKPISNSGQSLCLLSPKFCTL